MQPPVPQSSPPRPSTLPISEPKPVPTPVRRLSSTNDKHKRISDPQQQHQHHYQHSNGSSSSTSTSPPKNVAPNPIPRSQPISVKRSEHRSSVGSDINSISPPAVQFAIGTPPGSRRRSTSGGSLSETPPAAPCTWQVSPGSTQSPLRRSGNSSPVLPSALTKLPTLGSPTVLIGNENNNHPHVLGPRAFTLPEMGATGGLQSLLDTNNSEGHTIQFHAPELSEETLMGREHNETLSKLNFVLALTDCIQEVADSRCAPLSALMSTEAQPIPPHAPEHCKRTERLVLLVR